MLLKMIRNVNVISKKQPKHRLRACFFPNYMSSCMFCLANLKIVEIVASA